VWKWVLGSFLVLVLICGGGGFFFAKSEAGKKMFGGRDRQTEVRVNAVERGDLIRMVSAPGTVEPLTKVEISAQVSARITALPFREGDDVKKGDVLVRLDSEDYMASLDSAQASLKGDEARLDGLKAALIEATSERNRVRGLFETKDVAQAELDSVEASYLRALSAVKAGEHAIDIAKANIRRAQKDLDLCTITSPMDATIVLRNSEVGEQVLGTFNNAGSVIMELADLSVMVMRAKVDEANIAPVKAGQDATITINAYPERSFRGVVDLVGLKKQVDKDGTGYFQCDLLVKVEKPEDLPKGDRLRSGYAANADIKVQTHGGILKVPSQAVVDRRIDELPKELTSSANVDKNKTFARVVFKLVDGKATPVPVSIGSSDVTHTVIVSGLDDGEKIITGPYKVLTNLKPDQRVVEEGTEPKDGKGKKDGPVQAKSNGSEERKGS
jgi:HlyD family secretion protein